MFMMRLLMPSSWAGIFLVCGSWLAGTVEHKNLQLELYLDLIRYNSQEKIGIFPYILENRQGTYLEIGTGGDPIVEMLSKIPDSMPVTIVASDIEQAVLDAIPRRHPELEKYLRASEGVRLRLHQLNATDLKIFKAEELDGINASSLVHEIVSYAGGLEGLNSFFAEALRVLKPGGVLVYRDPESLREPDAPVVVSLKNKSIRLFAHIFFAKFLDRRGSALARAGKRFSLYTPQDISFCIYKKNEPRPITVSYDEYLAIPSYDIDFSRTFTLALPSGLYRECARHYITYLHQCNPLVFVRFLPDVRSGLYVPCYLSHSTEKILADFLGSCGDDFLEGNVSRVSKNTVDVSLARTMSVLEFGIPLHFSFRSHERFLRELLKVHGFEPSRYIIALNNGDCLLDYRIFGLLYDQITTQCFDHRNGPLEESSLVHARWLMREGEESYFYLSVDALITHILDQGIATKQPFVLFPISPDHIKFIERLCYTEVLREALDLYDDMGYPLEIKDGKQIVHFKKMSLDEALVLCRTIVERNPLEYPRLSEFLTQREI
jgi:SAM-dependent methyltransferase